jgi:hypothetical protein
MLVCLERGNVLNVTYAKVVGAKFDLKEWCLDPSSKSVEKDLSFVLPVEVALKNGDFLLLD